MTLAETHALVGHRQSVIASHYDSPERDRFNPSLVTSSGEIFDPSSTDHAASPIYPDGTQMAVLVPATGKGAIIRVTNAGPYYSGRLLDLSRGLAERLGIAQAGVAEVTIEILAAPTMAESRYVFGRRYRPLPGFVGPAADLDVLRALWLEKRPEPVAGEELQAAAETDGTAKVVVLGRRGVVAQGIVLRPAKQRRPHLAAIVAGRQLRRQARAQDASVPTGR